MPIRRIVNMIPNALSNETNQDSEPNLAVNPSNPLQIAGSAFTPDPLGGANAPIFVSTDGGQTWAINLIVPSTSAVGTGDITLRFGGTSNNLYAGILRIPAVGLRLNILRTNNFTAATPMTVLVDRDSPNRPDQPYIQVGTVMGGAGVGSDRVYVGNNDRPGSPAGRTATIDQHLDAGNATPPPPSGFTMVRLESRATSGQDGPPIRPIVHPSGVLYAVFYGWRSSSGSNITTDVVVVRDDNWGSGASPFTALTDTDGNSGVRVVTGRTVPWQNFSVFGQERFVSSNLTIAVDPRDSQRVYVAWADLVSSVYTLHVRRSADGGGIWSTADLRTVSGATNPALAINSRGVVGFMYQQLTGSGASQRWVTHLELTSNDWTTVDDMTLATVPANTPAATFLPYIGDYIHLMALGKDFYGIFSAGNTPNNANFPNGVTYQRNANFVANTLLGTDGVTPVAASIDPFFVLWTELAADTDFYVRDWTDSPTSGDTGLEPSTHPVFYATSDVWNRRSDAPGGFNAYDQPQSENPRMTSVGSNYAFARVRRNAGGSAATVTAHFLFSEFGVGSAYQNAGTAADPTISFATGDEVLTMANGYQWELPVTTSTHVCLAVEISTPADPVTTPTLLGRTPGWPTTDLMVINDNNKAQRNMGVYPAVADGASATLYAVARNAAFERRDMELRFRIPTHLVPRLRKFQLKVVGEGKAEIRGDRILLRGIQPGENRWVEIALTTPKGKEGETLFAIVEEMKGSAVVNGFGAGLELSPLRTVIAGNLAFQAQVFGRMAAIFDTPETRDEAGAAMRFEKGLSPDAYLEFLRDRQNNVEACVETLVRSHRGDPYDTRSAAKALRRGTRKVGAAASVHAILLHKLDAFMTMQQKRRGDVASILHNVEWQRHLFESSKILRTLPVAEGILDASLQFISAYDRRQIGNEHFRDFIRSMTGDFLEIAGSLRKWKKQLTAAVKAMSASDSLEGLQKSHREFLLILQDATG